MAMDFVTIEQALVKAEAFRQAKDFDEGLANLVRKELIMVQNAKGERKRGVLVHLSPHGFVIYKHGNANLLLTTLHTGSYVPLDVPFVFDQMQRRSEEDHLTFEFYLPIFLELGGYMVSTPWSRYFVDLNRPVKKAIMKYGNQGQPNYIDPSPIDQDRVSSIKKEFIRAANYYRGFYLAIHELIQQNMKHGGVFFNGHSMRQYNGDGTPRGSFCIIVDENDKKKRKDKTQIELAQELQKILATNFSDVRINDPFNLRNYNINGEGHFDVWAAEQSPNTRVITFETNKRLYLDPSRTRQLNEFVEVSRKVTRFLITYLASILNVSD